MEYTYLHLPIMDFRPYKIGNNIPELMEIPDDAEPDIYETTLIYEKDGVQQEFTTSNLPSKDEGWQFVERHDVIIEEGIEAPVHDFELTRWADGEEVTEDVLASAEPFTLVVMYDLLKADRSLLGRVVDLVQQNADACYILTGSGDEAIEAMLTEVELQRGSQARTAVEEAICTADPVMLKTIVRANPGVFVLQNGTVIDKYNLRNRQ
jgi:hypothetical protein